MTILVAVLALSLAHDDQSFALQQIRGLRDAFDSLNGVAKRQALEQIELLAGQHVSVSAADMVWVGQQWTALNEPARAIHALQAAIASSALGDAAHIAQFELGRALSSDGRSAEAERVWLEILDNEAVLVELRNLAAEQIRARALQRGDLEGAAAMARREMDEGFGSMPILLDTIARAARAQGDWETATDAYARILSEYPDFRAQNRMIYIEKAYLTTKYRGQRESLGYLEEMIATLARYERLAADANTMYAEIYQERYDLGTRFELLTSAYQRRGEPLPMSHSEARNRAIEQYLAALRGLSELPLEKRADVEFEIVLRNSYLSAINALEAAGREIEANALFAEMTYVLAGEDREFMPHAVRAGSGILARERGSPESLNVAAPSAPPSLPNRDIAAPAAERAKPIPAEPAESNQENAGIPWEWVVVTGVALILPVAIWRRWRAG